MAQERVTDGYQERLQRALREGPNPMSIRELGKALEAKGKKVPDPRGFTYGGIRQYMVPNKVKNPRLRVLRAAADILKVRFEYLAFNDGAMTVPEEVADYISPGAKRWFAEGGSPSFITRFGDWPDAAVNAAWIALSERYSPDQLTEVVEVDGVEVLRAMALYQQLADAALAPLDVLGVVPDEVTPAVEDYIVAVSLAIRQYLRATRTED
jgi:hypothetical protein